MTRRTSAVSLLVGAAMIAATALVAGCGSPDKVTRTTTEQTSITKPFSGGSTTTTTTTDKTSE